MLKGIYTSALSMKAQMNKMDVISNNIANVDTTGFKKDTATIQSFSEELAKRVNANDTLLNVPKDIGGISLGIFVQNIFTDFSTGSFERTDNELDLAISGDGFFSIQYRDDDGNISETYSRDGSFTLSDSGVLMTKDGHRVLGEKGIITLSDGVIKIDDDGNIYSNDVFIDKLKLVSFEDNKHLQKIGDNMYRATETSTTKTFTSKISQGFLESSNVSSVYEMVDMISLSRAYEANQRAITVHDSTLARAVNDIARK